MCGDDVLFNPHLYFDTFSKSSSSTSASALSSPKAIERSTKKSGSQNRSKTSSAEWLKALRAKCDALCILLIFDILL